VAGGDGLKMIAPHACSGRGRYFPFQRQMRQKGMDLRRTHGSRMPFVFVMEEDEACDPVDLGAFGTHAVMFEANVVTHKVQAFRLVVHQYTTI
jgi:hypothetical protein